MRASIFKKFTPVLYFLQKRVCVILMRDEIFLKRIRIEITVMTFVQTIGKMDVNMMFKHGCKNPVAFYESGGLKIFLAAKPESLI